MDTAAFGIGPSHSVNKQNGKKIEMSMSVCIKCDIERLFAFRLIKANVLGRIDIIEMIDINVKTIIT